MGSDQTFVRNHRSRGLDGFRALAHIRGHRCELISRNRHTFKQWPQLAEEIAHAVRAHSAVLDGDIWCLEPDGGTESQKLLSGGSGALRQVKRPWTSLR